LTTKRIVKRKTKTDQHGIGSFKAIAAIVGIGLTFLMLFIFVGGSGTPKTKSDDTAKTNGETLSPPASQPNVIRIPDNYTAYVNKNYKLSFAHPTPWATSIIVKGPTDTAPVPSSPQAASSFKNYGLGSSILNGQLVVYVDKQDAFSMLLHTNGAVIAPVKLGDGYGWKVVQAGAADPTLKVGDSYNIKSATYQSGIPVYNFTVSVNNTLQGRWVFQSGENFVAVSLPTLSRTDNSAPSAADIALYNIISNNVAKTSRPTN
jgi:hypothetical protein